MSDNWNSYSLSGCLFEATPKPAPELSFGNANLPNSVDLRAHCSPIENQLKTNSCVANAVVGALEFHQKKAGLPVTDLSRLFVYYNARSLAEMEAQDIGSHIHHGMAAILAYGACEARLWPFEEGMLTTRPTQACYENAMHYEAVQYARTPRGTPALTVLSQGLPVVFGMYAPMAYYDAAHQTGVMPKPDQVEPGQPPAGHAMLIVGYDLTDKTYLVRNSWGTGWADQGYVKIPFETLEAWSMPDHFWTIGAIEQAQGLKLSGPSLTDSMMAVGVTEESLQATGNSLDQLRAQLRTELTSGLDSAKRGFRSRLRGE